MTTTHARCFITLALAIAAVFILGILYARAGIRDNADAVPIMGGTMIPGTYRCTDKNDNPGLLYWVRLEPRCGLSPAKPKTYIPINNTVPDYFAPPQCDKFEGAEYNVCVNREWEKRQQEPLEKPPLPSPRPVRFRPTQQVWQCNDLRVTVTQTAPFTWNYDIGGTIWGGINFTSDGPNLYLRGIPCVPLR
jgi:hypothetical protein